MLRLAQIGMEQELGRSPRPGYASKLLICGSLLGVFIILVQRKEFDTISNFLVELGNFLEHLIAAVPALATKRIEHLLV